MDALQDEEMQDVLAPQPDETLPLSDDEQRVLELYDQLKQLQMEIAIINAQSHPEIGTCLSILAMERLTTNITQ